MILWVVIGRRGGARENGSEPTKSSQKAELEKRNGKRDTNENRTRERERERHVQTKRAELTTEPNEKK